jgi:hypothetical protein
MRGFIPLWLMWLGHGGSLPNSESVSSLHCLMLSIEFLGAGSHSLPLAKGAPSFKGEADVRPRHRHPWWNHRRGLSSWSVLQPWCGCDGSRQSPHVVPSGRGGAFLFARNHVELLDGVPYHGPQRGGGSLRVEPMGVTSESLPWERGSGHQSSRR